MLTGQAPTVTDDGDKGAAPGLELSFRDFAELLVRLAAAMCPSELGLAAQLQQLVSRHLEPLFACPPAVEACRARLPPAVSDGVQGQLAALLGAFQEAVRGPAGAGQQQQQQQQQERPSSSPEAAAIAAAAAACRCGCCCGCCGRHASWQHVATARQVVAWLHGQGVLKDAQGVAHAVANLCSIYLQAPAGEEGRCVPCRASARVPAGPALWACGSSGPRCGQIGV
jgi:hypothetical protein